MPSEYTEERTLEFIGLDDWNRPVFRLPGTNLHFGSTNKLFNWEGTNNDMIVKITNVLSLSELEYFGNSFNCEPHGGYLFENKDILTFKSGAIVKVLMPKVN